jgi:hypothetical protein
MSAKTRALYVAHSHPDYAGLSESGRLHPARRARLRITAAPRLAH